MSQETQTPRTDRAGEDGMYSTMVNHALALELELNATKEAVKYYADLARENGIKTGIVENALSKEREYYSNDYEKLRELAKQIANIVK